MVWDELTKLNVERLGLLPDVYKTYAAQNVFEKTASFRTFDRTLTTPGSVERLSAIMAEPSLLELLGAKPQVGRLFTHDDGEAVAVISQSLFLPRIRRRSPHAWEKNRSR